MSTVLQRVLFFALIPVVIAVHVIAAVFGGPGLTDHPGGNGFLIYALIGVFGMHMLLCDSRRERMTALVAGSVIVLPISAHLAVTGSEDPFWQFLMVASLAAVSLAIQGASIVASTGADRHQRVALFCNSLIIPLSVSVTPFFLWLSLGVNPTFDLHLFAFEATFGMQPAAIMVAFLDAVPPLRWLCTLVYLALPLAMVILFVCQHDRPDQPSIIVLFTVATLIGFPLYFVFPIAGPLQVFGDAFPYALPAVDAVVIEPTSVIAAPRNGMPSLHAAWAYLIWFNTKLLPLPSRIGFRIFVVLTLIATMGMRDAHWLTDLVVALPMAVAIQAAFTPMVPLQSAERWRTVFICAVLVGAWSLALRYGIPVFQKWPGLSWGAVAATTGLSIALLASVDPLPKQPLLWRRGFVIGGRA